MEFTYYWMYYAFMSVIYFMTAKADVLMPRGISLLKATFYDPSKDFLCLDGSGRIPFSYVNDDYCDCLDGSDEPGTAACPNGTFHCVNHGHRALDIPSSRVNDGICDCCDASDEYVSSVSCVNICQELGREAREQAHRQFEMQQQGYQLKLEYSKQGKLTRQEKQERLKKLEEEKNEAEAVKSEKESSKAAAEEPEKEALQKYHAAEDAKRKEQEEEQKKKREQEAVDAFEHLDSNMDGKIQVAELQSHQMFDQNRDGIVSEEEAKFFLQQQEEMDQGDFLTTGWILMKPYFERDRGMFVPPEATTPQPDEEPPTEDFLEPEKREGVDYETEAEEIDKENEENLGEHDDMDEYEDYDDEREEDDEEPEETTDDHKHDDQQIYDEETQRLVDAANKARDEYEEADRHVRDINREIKQLQDFLGIDFGTHEEFMPLQDQCFEYTDREYTYKLCAFDKASQRPKNGGSETKLGSWSHWAGPADGNIYSKMLFDKGQQCWNGPQRSAMVELHCGVENEILSVSEPNRCEYLYIFSSPAACNVPVPVQDQFVHDEL